ncbi:hypothetical protein ACP4OV_010395 [Aristida adscensionis]
MQASRAVAALRSSPSSGGPRSAGMATATAGGPGKKKPCGVRAGVRRAGRDGAVGDAGAVPEVAAPDLAVDEADRFLHRPLFRHAPAAEKKAVTLRDAGVEPPGIERNREEVLAAMNVLKRESAKKMNA